MSAEQFNFQSPAVHWMSPTPSLNCLSCKLLTKVFIHWMPCPHSVKRRFSSLISASSHPLPQTPLQIIRLLLINIVNSVQPSRPGPAIGSRFSANGYAIDLGQVFCDPICDQSCNPVIIRAKCYIQYCFGRCISVILDAETNCDRNYETPQIQAYGARSKLLNCKSNRDRSCLIFWSGANG